MNLKYYPKNIIKHQYKENLFAAISIFIITFIFMMQSPLNILNLNGNSSTDSSVLRTIAMQMKYGLMPYRDSFDHKGPLLYLYNYWGILIEPQRGIWVVEFISTFTAFYFMYKTAELKCAKPQALIVLIICVAPLYVYFEQGNLSEEYALPFISVAVYFFSDYFIYGTISRIRLTICGLGFGAICMLRANMITIWIVFCCAVLVQKILMKRLRELIKFSLWFFLGIGIIVIPICYWLIINKAFVDLLMTILCLISYIYKTRIVPHY